MRRVKSSSRKIDTVFVIMLFTIFAAISILIVLLFAKQYKHTAAVNEHNYEIRTANSYLREIVHQHDKANSIGFRDFAGVHSITFSEEINGYTIVTYVYCYEGYIRELSIVNGAEIRLESGVALVPAQKLDISLLENLAQFTYVDSAGITHELSLSLHSSIRKETT